MRTLTEISRERDRLRDRRSDLKARASALAAAPGEWSEDRSDEGGRIAGELDTLDTKLGRLDDEYTEALTDAYKRGRVGTEHVADVYERVEDRAPGGAAGAGRDVGLRAIDRHRDKLTAPAGDRLERLVRGNDPMNIGARYLAAVGDPDYASAFGKMLLDPATGHLRFTAHEVEAVRRVSRVMEMRGMVEGTGSAGGFGVPFALDASIMLSSAGAVNPVRELARIETIVVETWRGVSSDGVVASFSAEAAEVADGTPVLAQPEVKTEKAHCFVPFSIEVGQDYGGVEGLLEAELAPLFADAKNVLESNKFLLGTGTNEPGGILNIGGTGGLTTAQRIQTDVAATLDIDDVWDLKGNLANSRFYENSVFAGNPGMFDRVFRFTPAGSTTEPQAMPDRGGPLMGRPVAEWSNMVNTTTTGSRVLILGDWQNFRIVDRIGMNVELLPHLLGANRRPSGERGLYAYWRVGSGVTVLNGFRYLEVL
jgi:HK97 family phage major capsid protein